MKTTQLKNLIRATVREAINEMLAEKFLESTINEMFSKRQGRSLQEEVCLEEEEEEIRPKKKSPKVQEDKTILQEHLRKNLGFEQNNMLNDLFADTYYNNPSMDESKAPVAGEISESDMEKIGIMDKDWSRFL